MSERETRTRVRERTRKVWEGSRYASIGIEFGLSVIIGYLAGRWLEQRYDWSPWGTTFGTLFGFAAALRSLMRLAAKEERRTQHHKTPSSIDQNDSSENDSSDS